MTEITLTKKQVARVIRSVSGLTAVSGMFEDLDNPHGVRDALAPLLHNASYSRSTLLAVQVLGAFPPDGRERELAEIARELELSPSTLHRYVGTWRAIGLIDQNPISRRYKRVRVTFSHASPH